MDYLYEYKQLWSWPAIRAFFGKVVEKSTLQKVTMIHLIPGFICFAGPSS